MSKFGSKFGGALSSTKQFAQRTTQKVKVKTGRAEETVDVELNAMHEQFEGDFEQIKTLKKDLKKYLILLKEISVHLSTVAVDLKSTLESSPSNLTVVAGTLQGRCGECDKARDSMEHRVHEHLGGPLSTFVHQYKSLVARWKIHEHRRVDKDRFYAKKLKLSEKDKNGELPHVEAQYNASVENYQSLNAELHRDFPALHNDRYLFFEPFLTEFILAQNDYFQEMAAIFGSLPPMVQHINTATLLEHPAVITPDESTSAGQEAFVPKKKKKGEAAEPQAVGGAAPPPSSTVPNQYAQGPSQGAQVGGAPAGGAAGARAAAPAPVPRKPPVPATPSGPKAKGLYAFQAADNSELSFNPGDVLTIHTQSGEWWEAELHGQRGLIPANYVQLV